MSDLEQERADISPQGTSQDGLASLIQKPTTRRRFLQLAGVGGVSFALIGLGDDLSSVLQGRQVFSANAEGLVIANPTRCVGCRRCELACTEFNEGRAYPTMARIKVGRNYNFGPNSAEDGFWQGEGRWGNHLLIQDTCKQCPHPIPCQLACPNDAIEVVPPVNARVVNQEKCIGCRICQRACPWGMTSFDEDIQKATKCHLCDGNPKCVQACPVGALQYIPWEDKTLDVPARYEVPGYIAMSSDVAETCAVCHTK